jgi:hypothetical protein
VTLPTGLNADSVSNLNRVSSLTPPDLSALSERQSQPARAVNRWKTLRPARMRSTTPAATGPKKSRYPTNPACSSMEASRARNRSEAATAEAADPKLLSRGTDVVPVRRFAIKRMKLVTPAQRAASIGVAEGSRKPAFGAEHSHALAAIGDHGCNVIFSLGADDCSDERVRRDHGLGGT